MLTKMFCKFEERTEKLNFKNLICHSLVFILFWLQMRHPTVVHEKKQR